jgi:hypothetical protein
MPRVTKKDLAYLELKAEAYVSLDDDHSLERLLRSYEALEADKARLVEALEKIERDFRFNSDLSGKAAGIARAALSKEESDEG